MIGNYPSSYVFRNCVIEMCIKFAESALHLSLSTGRQRFLDHYFLRFVCLAVADSSMSKMSSVFLLQPDNRRGMGCWTLEYPPGNPIMFSR